MPDSRKYAIGDVHGCYKTLKTLLFDVIKIQPKDKLFFLGDYVDRGPDSRGVLDLLMELRAGGWKIVPLMGNHDFMFLEFLLGKQSPDWMRNGGNFTLSSFPDFNVEKKYKDFILRFEYYVSLKKYYLVHGGFNFSIKYPLKDKSSMIWIRNDYVNRDFIKDKQMIVGHTPKSLSTIKRSLNDDIIYLDGGCVYSRQHQDLGYLCALELRSKELYYTYNCDY